jgi:DNA-binding HxlR family transcriptional regulator
MRTYGQYCPIARGAEIFAERWTPLIIRNLHLGCDSFTTILEGAPGLSRTLLSQRLRQLERFGIVMTEPKPDGHGSRYELTSAGHDLYRVCELLGEWGAAWLEIAPEHLDPFVALWSMCNALRRDRLPDQRVVVSFDFTRGRHHERYWLLIEHRDTEICKEYSGLDEDLYVTAEAEAFRQVAHGPAQLGGSHPQRPHHGARPAAARSSLPHLERPQRVRTRQAGVAFRRSTRAEVGGVVVRRGVVFRG